VKFLRDRNVEDNHAYAEVAHRFGADALLDSHLPMVDMLARDYQAMDSAEARHAGLAYALKVLAKSYASTPSTARSGVRKPTKETSPRPRCSVG
jgi:hypothetical protein